MSAAVAIDSGAALLPSPFPISHPFHLIPVFRVVVCPLPSNSLLSAGTEAVAEKRA